MENDIKVLIIDDDLAKFRKIAEVLIDSRIQNRNIMHAPAIQEARSILDKDHFDLLILDIGIPLSKFDEPKIKNGIDFLHELNENTELKKPRYVICITALENDFEQIDEEIQDGLWQLIFFDDSKDTWKKKLKTAISYLAKSQSLLAIRTYNYDVLFVCALEALELGNLIKQGDWQEEWIYEHTKIYSTTLEIRGRVYKLAAATQKRMGMVFTGLITTQLIDMLTPRIVVMTGICGGYKEYVNLGDIVIADPVWEYQYGKVVSLEGEEKLIPTIDQYRIDNTVLSHLRDFCSKSEILADIVGSSPVSGPTEVKAEIGPFVTGSAVVASKEYADKIKSQTRDIIALDMEIFGLYASAHSSFEPRPRFFAVKSVSDFADESKNDNLQEFCAYVSARFVLEFLKAKIHLII